MNKLNNPEEMSKKELANALKKIRERQYYHRRQYLELDTKYWMYKNKYNELLTEEKKRTPKKTRPKYVSKKKAPLFETIGKIGERSYKVVQK